MADTDNMANVRNGDLLRRRLRLRQNVAIYSEGI